MPTEHDALINHGVKRIDAHESGQDQAAEPVTKTILHASCLFLGPFISFLTMMACVHELYHKYSMVVLLICGLLLVFSVGWTMIPSHKKWFWYMGMLCKIGTIAGLVVGCYIYYKHMIYYHAYGDLRKYTNVAASSNCAEFSDAGMLLFTKDSKVDTTLAVGMISPEEEGTIFCVAPIVDGSMNKDSPISFWAIGTNCCQERAHFECDDAKDPNAQAGMVLVDVSLFTSAATSWLVTSMSDDDQFQAAIKLQKAVYGTTGPGPNDNVLLRWTKDPIHLQDTFWREGVEYITYSIVCYAILSLALGIMSAIAARPAKKMHLGE